MLEYPFLQTVVKLYLRYSTHKHSATLIFPPMAGVEHFHTFDEIKNFKNPMKGKNKNLVVVSPLP